MGNRFWLGLGILLGLLAVSLGVSAAMSNIHRPAAEAFSQAAQKAMGGELETAKSLAAEGTRRWHAGRTFTACVADHAPMDDVESLLAEMQVFAEESDAEHFAACCAQLAEAVKAMSEAHSPAWWNLF